MKLDADLEVAIEEDFQRYVREGLLPRRYFPEGEDIHASEALLQDLAASSSRHFRSRAVATTNLQTRAIIRASKRPSVLVRNGSFEAPDGESWQQLLDQNRPAIERSIPAVGRMELEGHPNLQWCGTGFLVASDTVATNRHVAELFLMNDGQGFTWKTDASGTAVHARIDFRGEHEIADHEKHTVVDVLHVEPPHGPDLALLRIDPLRLQCDPLAFSTTVGIDDLVVTIGYPCREPSMSPDFEAVLERIFGTTFGVKRLAPGKVTKASTTTIWHDCTTLGGNSGSAVIDVESGAVIGLHYGNDLDWNLAVPSGILKDRLAAL